MFSIDLKDSYFVMFIHPASLSYLWISLSGRVSGKRHSALAIPQLPRSSGVSVGSQMRDLPFLIFRQLVDHCRFSSSFARTLRAPSQSLQRPWDSHQLKGKKSDFKPTCKTQYLRMLIYTVWERAYPMDSWIIKVQDVAGNFLHLSSPQQNCGGRSWTT